MTYLSRLSTLCYDSGTVWTRFFFAAGCSPSSTPLLLKAIPDSDLPDGVLSSANILNVLTATFKELSEYGVHVCGVVADNAANMQSAAASQEEVFSIRCACHVIQLIAAEVLQNPTMKEMLEFCQHLAASDDAVNSKKTVHCIS